MYMVFFLITLIVISYNSLADTITEQKKHLTPKPAMQSTCKIFYVDGKAGNDKETGTSGHPWLTIDHAIKQINAGDTVIIADGIYRIPEIRFGPAGKSASRMTVFKAAPKARAIITAPADSPPPIYLQDYVLLDGLWMGGRRNTNLHQTGKKNSNKAAQKSTGIFTGGSPISSGIQIINCTIWGYRAGISQGSAEYTLYQGNRFVLNGKSRFLHGIYLSGGTHKGKMAQHAIVDNNIFIGGEGYAIHGWHKTHSNIVTRNFITGHYWGLVLDGSDHLAANNLFWRLTGQKGREGPFGVWLPGEKIIFINNILGPNAGILSLSFHNSGIVANNAFLGVDPHGKAPIILAHDSVEQQLGISAPDIDDTVQILKQAFARSIESIYADTRIEPAFARLKITIPDASPLKQSGRAWFNKPSKPVNIGPDASCPSDIKAFWKLFRGAGLRDFDRYGRVTK